MVILSPEYRLALVVGPWWGPLHLKSTMSCDRERRCVTSVQPVPWSRVWGLCLFGVIPRFAREWLWRKAVCGCMGFFSPRTNDGSRAFSHKSEANSCPQKALWSCSRQCYIFLAASCTDGCKGLSSLPCTVCISRFKIRDMAKEN